MHLNYHRLGITPYPEGTTQVYKILDTMSGNMNTHPIRMESSWKAVLHQEFQAAYFPPMAQKIRGAYLSQTVYPPPTHIFRAFDLCPFDKVKVVIIGQDPYHGIGQANGLCFAVEEGQRIPPSLVNIFKEIRQDVGIEPTLSGDLSRWAYQGVLMLNAVLTVLAGQPASHAGIGWEQFTDAVIRTVNAEKKNVVYLLWGKYAQQKGVVIDRERNLVLSSGHPSPFSARLFHGNHHFSSCNEYLVRHGKTPIDWR